MHRSSSVRVTKPSNRFTVGQREGAASDLQVEVMSKQLIRKQPPLLCHQQPLVVRRDGDHEADVRRSQHSPAGRPSFGTGDLAQLVELDDDGLEEIMARPWQALRG